MLKALVYLMVWSTVLTLVVGVVVVVGGAALVVGLIGGTVAVVRTVRQRRADTALAAERAEQELAHRAEAEDERFRSGDMRGIFGEFPPVDDTGQSLYTGASAPPVPSRHPSIEAAITRCTMPSRIRKKARGLERHLSAGEEVTALAIGLHDAKSGVLALTDQRLLYLVKDAVRIDIALGQVTDVHCRPKMLFGHLTVRHNGNETVFDCEKDDGGPLTNVLRAQIRRTTSTTVATRPSRPVAPIRKRTPPPPNVAPGWYPDRPGAPMQRYWDGDGWTEHTGRSRREWATTFPRRSGLADEAPVPATPGRAARDRCVRSPGHRLHIVTGTNRRAKSKESDGEAAEAVEVPERG